tara:strand:- start:1238 stop:1885 length:648 start_codon:yes stop_codon:yes gene_type:complete
MSKNYKKPLESFTGGFSRIPHAVMDSAAFIGLTDRGKSLLFALMRQINGSNNGRLQLTNKWLAEHGWRSASLNKITLIELVDRGLVVVTRLGGLNAGRNLHALTWLPISNFTGLDITANTFRQGCWTDCKLPPTKRRKPPQQKQKKPSDYRDSAIPTTGSERQATIPITGTRAPISILSTVPTTGNNVSMPYTPQKTNQGSRRIVGKSRKNGAQN